MTFSQYRRDQFIYGGQICEWPILFWIIGFTFLGRRHVIPSVINSGISLALLIGIDKVCARIL